MEKRTSVTLDYLDMEPALQLSKSKPDILKKLADELVSSDSVESRIYGYKNSHGETTSIFISDFINLDNAFFCTLMDMEEGAAANIPQKLLQSKKFSLEDTSVSKKKDIIGHIKTATYFLMTPDSVILMRKKGLEKEIVEQYLSFFLHLEAPEGKKPLNLLYHPDKNFDVSRIKSFELDDGYKIKEESLFNTVERVLDLRTILQAPEMEGLDPEKVLSAKIVFKIKNLPKKDEVENKAVINRLLTSFNTENVTFRDRNNTSIDMSHVKKTKQFQMSIYNSEYPDKNKLIQKMQEFYAEVQNEKKYSDS